MMRIIYDLIIFIYSSVIRVAAFFGNDKAKLWISGRKNWRVDLAKAISPFKDKQRFWFHCASLGEFEQGRALIEKVRSEFPDAFILLTFFSPSGYEIRKNYPGVNYVAYLPSDTKSNATVFLNELNPTQTFFIKYEFWFHYFNELEKRKLPVYVVSAIFRPTQIFFKWYGSFYLNILRKITHIFLQNSNSLKLLSEKGISNCSVAGDTRFDRVNKIAQEAKDVPKLSNFIGKSRAIIAGSTWPADEEVLLKIFQHLNKDDLKLVIVPHEVDKERIAELKNKISDGYPSLKIALYSQEQIDPNASILIVDVIGILSSAYKYSTITWVGGGFDKGIHNILEPAAHGKPVLFGPNFQKFREAHELISNRSAFSITDTTTGKLLITKLLTDQSLLKQTGESASNYVQSNVGASEKIFNSVFKKG